MQILCKSHANLKQILRQILVKFRTNLRQISDKSQARVTTQSILLALFVTVSQEPLLPGVCVCVGCTPILAPQSVFFKKWPPEHCIMHQTSSIIHHAACMIYNVMTYDILKYDIMLYIKWWHMTTLHMAGSSLPQHFCAERYVFAAFAIAVISYPVIITLWKLSKPQLKST